MNKEHISARKWQCVAIFFLAVSNFFSCSTTKTTKKMDASNFPDRVNQVTDAKSNLECSLTILQGADGGASAVVVELSNLSKDHDVNLKVNTEMSAFIMLTATDQQGTVLSMPAKRFNTSETQQFVMVRIERASSHQWRVPIANQLPVSDIPEQGMKGRLVVNVALLFSKASGDKQPSDVDFQNSLLTLYDMDILFTRNALRGE